MEQKAKFIIIGLAGLLVIAVIFAGQLYGTKSKLEAEVKNLNDTNTALQENLNNLRAEKESIQNRANSLEQELNGIQKERENLQRMVDSLNKEKEDLIAKIKTTKETPQQPQAPQVPSATANDAYWANILKSNADLELKLGNLRNELREVQIKNEELLRNKASLDLEIANLNRDKKDLQRQIDYNQKLLDNLTTELVTERNNKFKLQDTLKTIKAENSTLRRQLNALNSKKIDLEKKLEDLKENKSSLERDFKNMEVMVKGKADEVCRLKEQLGQAVEGATTPAEKSAEEKGSINLPAIVVHPQSEEIKTELPSPSLVGKVMAVNRDNNFVIIDLGQDSGVKQGQTFQVFRDEEAVGSIVVSQVRKDISACDIKTEMTPIKLGDKVK